MNEKLKAIRVQMIIEHLSESHLDNDGGYPFDYGWIGDVLVVAELGEKGTRLARYSRDYLSEWISEINIHRNEFDSLLDAIHECQPDSELTGDE